jgi:CHAD domain-containing protein
MPCDTAFRIVARRYLAGLDTSQPRTCKGDPEALHHMRVALTHLRAAILFFSPMVDDKVGARIRDEFKWLNGQLGSLRDLDVTIERISAMNPDEPQAIPDFQAWRDRRQDVQRKLTRSLQSARYRRLIERASRWIESGPWSTQPGKRAAQRRGSPIGPYSAGKLAQWEETLLRKCRKLRDMGAKKRHRLRLLNKKLNYSIESVAELLADKRLSRQRGAIKPLRRAQKSLGQLNDDVRSRALLRELRRQGIRTPLQALGPKAEKRLLRSTEAAYRKLAALKPWT